MTGTKFGCGAAQCLSCAVIVDNPDGTSHTSPTCIVAGGELQRQVDPHRRGPRQGRRADRRCRRPSSTHFAFQCGYCTAGFLNEGQVLLERLAKKPVRARRAREDHRGGARRASVPLHRLRQVSRGGARRDPRRSEALPRREQARRNEIRNAVPFVAVAGALPLSRAARLCRADRHDARAAGELCVDRRHRAALGRVFHRARQGADPSALRELSSGRRPAAPGR